MSSSINMPVKWLCWFQLSVNTTSGEINLICNQTWSPFFISSVDWIENGVCCYFQFACPSTWPRPIWTPFIIRATPNWAHVMLTWSEREEISSPSQWCEFPRMQIHGSSGVHLGQLERNRNTDRVKVAIPLNVEIGRKRFDIGVSDPLLESLKTLLVLCFEEVTKTVSIDLDPITE